MTHYLATRSLPTIVKGWTGEILACTALLGGLLGMTLGI